MSRFNAQKDQWSEWMQAALSGDSSAYKRVLEAVAPVLRNYIYGVLARSRLGTSDVDDVVQDVLLAIHLRRHTWDSALPFRPWAFAIARHKAIDWLRRKGRRIEVPIDEFEDVIPMPASSETDLSRDLPRYLAELPARQREIVTAISVEGLSIRDTASRFGIEQGAVRVALHRGLRTLAALFHKAEQ